MPDDKDDKRSATRPEGVNPMVGSSGVTASIVSVSQPLKLIEYEHALQLLFCDRLEQIADALPSMANKNLVHGVSQLLREGMWPHMRMEEEMLFPLLRQRCPADELLEEVFGQLEKEHQQDADLEIEIAEELNNLLRTGAAHNAEMLGYMLRGYFYSQRRHIEWENRVVLPLARERLNQDDLARLSDWMDRNDHRRFTDLLHLIVSSWQDSNH